jgi:hypothetical protein
MTTALIISNFTLAAIYSGIAIFIILVGLKQEKKIRLTLLITGVFILVMNKYVFQNKMEGGIEIKFKKIEKL